MQKKIWNYSIAEAVVRSKKLLKNFVRIILFLLFKKKKKTLLFSKMKEEEPKASLYLEWLSFSVKKKKAFFWSTERKISVSLLRNSRGKKKRVRLHSVLRIDKITYVLFRAYYIFLSIQHTTFKTDLKKKKKFWSFYNFLQA